MSQASSSQPGQPADQVIFSSEDFALFFIRNVLCFGFRRRACVVDTYDSWFFWSLVIITEALHFVRKHGPSLFYQAVALFTQQTLLIPFYCLAQDSDVISALMKSGIPIAKSVNDASSLALPPEVDEETHYGLIAIGSVFELVSMFTIFSSAHFFSFVFVFWTDPLKFISVIMTP
jgi:hypothetical protein